MSVTVSDVLQLDILNSAKVIAGKNGLDREVLRINFTDCPINPLVDADLILLNYVYMITGSRKEYGWLRGDRADRA